MRTGQEGHNFPSAELYLGATIKLRVTSKNLNNVTNTFLNRVHLVLKDLRFELGGPNLLLAPGAILPHYSPVRRWIFLLSLNPIIDDI